MDDPEMEYLQSVDSASCAVWEWMKGLCKQRDESRIPEMGKVEVKMVCRRLGIDEDRLNSIVGELNELGWVDSTQGACFVAVTKWDMWQTNFRSSDSDARRKKDSYWKKKVEGDGKLRLSVPANLQNAEFLKEWKCWMRYRRSHQAQIADEAIFFQKQLDWLAGFGPKKSREILSIAMRNSWQGLEAAARNISS